MSVSEKQLLANRANAKKSTGPKTKEGKAVSSKNGITYGLFAKDLIINSTYHDENKEEFDQLLCSLRDELKPTSGFQNFLVQKIAACLWRARRAAIAETAHINKRLDNLNSEIRSEQFLHAINHKDEDIDNYQPPDFESPDSQELINLVNLNCIPDQRFATRVLYYEMRLDRQLSRAFYLLQKLQGRGLSGESDKGGKSSAEKGNVVRSDYDRDIIMM